MHVPKHIFFSFHTLCLSCRFVSMTIDDDCCSQTILQKSSNVGGTGPMVRTKESKLLNINPNVRQSVVRRAARIGRKKRGDDERGENAGFWCQLCLSKIIPTRRFYFFHSYFQAAHTLRGDVGVRFVVSLKRESKLPYFPGFE